MARHAHEFQCDHNCGWFNYPMLDDSMTGNYIIVCGNPACRHEHYRTIVKGVVTSDRHDARHKNLERIHVMPSAASPKKRELGLIAQFRAKVAAGLAE